MVEKYNEGGDTIVHKVVYRGGQIFDRSRKVVTPADELHDSIKTAIDILNTMRGFEVGTPFYVRMVEVFENEIKRRLWFQMLESA